MLLEIREERRYKREASKEDTRGGRATPVEAGPGAKQLEHEQSDCIKKGKIKKEKKKDTLGLFCLKNNTDIESV